MRKHMLKLVAFLLLFGLPALSLAADPTPRPTPIRKAVVDGVAFDASVAGTAKEGGDYTCTFTYAAAGGVESVNDNIGLCKLPKGAVLTDWYLYVPAQGTAFVMSLGLQESVATLLTTSTCGAAAGSCSSADAGTNGLTAGALPASALAADTYLQIKVTTAATTPNATVSTIRGWVRYHTRGNGTF